MSYKQTKLEEYTDPNLYDAEYGGYQGDFDFFLNLTKRGSVLDLGCGTGRLTIPFAQNGYSAVGLDASLTMLALAQKKSVDLDIKWVNGDIRNFQLDRSFDLIVMAGNTFQALLSESDQMSMLQCVKNHLKPSGVFAFNTRNPQEDDAKTISEFELWHSFRDSNGDEVRVYGKQDIVGSQQNIIYTTKRVWKNRHSVTQIRLKFSSQVQLLQLLVKSGFEVISVFGDDKQSAFQPKSPSIFTVCRVNL